MILMKTAIIFDLDGTILDTLEDLYLSVNFAMREFGFPERTIDEVRSFVGNGMPKLIERSLPSGVSREVFDSALECFKKYYNGHSTDHTCPYENIPEALHELKDRGYVLGVLTNKAHTATIPLCEKYFSGIFDIVLGQSESFPVKPDPTALFFVKGELCADKMIYVGDSEVDIQTAKNAEIPCVSVSWGFKTREFLLSHGAELVAGTASGMLDCIYKISEN